jgi:DNA-binding MarR family transcriptional regulator
LAVIAMSSSAEQNPGALLREVARLYTRAQRLAAVCCRTTNTQCHILTELGRSGPQPMAELGQRLSLEKSWVSRALDSLVGEGLVAKKDHPKDARSWIVSLTAAGKRRVDQLNITLDEHATQLLDKLSATERAETTQSLQRILGALRTDAGLDACSQPDRASVDE